MIDMERAKSIRDAYKKGYEEAKKEFERPHGEWKHDPNGWFCSACDHGWEYVKTPSDFLSFNFCPNCGASMRKEGDGE